MYGSSPLINFSFCFRVGARTKRREQNWWENYVN